MGKLSEYVIPFSGLSIGKHTYDFDIDQKFFDEYGTELVNAGSIQLVLELTKSGNMLQLVFKHKGYMNTVCDRCLNDIQMPLQGENRVIVKFGAETGDESEEIVVLPTTAHEINVAPLVYEFIGTSVPYRLVPADCDAQDKYCDTEIGSRLSGIIDVPDDEDVAEPAPDPRWAKLKNLLDDNNNSKKE